MWCHPERNEGSPIDSTRSFVGFRPPQDDIFFEWAIFGETLPIVRFADPDTREYIGIKGYSLCLLCCFGVAMYDIITTKGGEVCL